MQNGDSLILSLEKLAANGGEMPQGLELPEQLLMLTLRELYHSYKTGSIERERGKREKAQIMLAYRTLKSTCEMSTKYYADITRRLEQNIGELYKCGCPSCQKLIRIFHGIERNDIPEDVKMLHEHNQQLRDLVQERSERAGYLATVIDKIKWALDDGDIERAKQIINERK